MGKLKDLTGLKFGRLTVIKRVENNKHNQTCWLCKCDCGNEKIIEGYSLTRGRTQSCGCLLSECSRERTTKRNFKHGFSNHKLHGIWDNMKQRCYNPNSKSYADYGARGIKICQEWQDDFMNFYNWAMANGYKEGLTIDRIDVNGNYEPNNCRWIALSMQSDNRRDTVYIEYKGHRYTRKEFSIKFKINYWTLRYRISKGLPIDDLIDKNT